MGELATISNPSLLEIGEESARLHSERIKAESRTPTTIDVTASLERQICLKQQGVERFRNGVAEVLSDTGLNADEIALAELRARDIMSGMLATIGDLSMSHAIVMAREAEEKVTIEAGRDEVMRDVMDHFTKNEGALFELAVIEAHIEGYTPDLQCPIIIGGDIIRA